jgi:hypothetical protein
MSRQDGTATKPPERQRPIGWNQPKGIELIRGFDTPQPYREDTIIRIRRILFYSADQHSVRLSSGDYEKLKERAFLLNSLFFEPN